MKKLAIILFLLSQFVVGQNANKLFEEANKYYQEEHYQKAIDKYLEIVKSGVESSELHFNLANSYYKLNKVASCIYHYEKALLIDPLNEDATINLKIARQLTIDSIEALPKSVFQNIDDAIVKKLSFNTWAKVTVTLSVLGGLFFLLYYFAVTPVKKRIFFTSSILIFVACFFSLAISYKEYNHFNNFKEAIIFEEKIDIKNAPSLNAESVFTLHEGTKVIVLDKVDYWNKIKIADGQIGWIPNSSLKVLQSHFNLE